MNIDGHEIERHADGLVYVDDDDRGWEGDNADAYARSAEVHARWADRHRLVAEFVRREAAEKAADAAEKAADAATELDRRAAIARKGWIEADEGTAKRPWSDVSAVERGWWRNVVRALDADATEREA